MPRFLNTSGNASFAIFICDRCKMKRPMDSAMPDINMPGLRVCSVSCQDQKDPYRLAPRRSEKISLRFPRLDVNVAVDPEAITTELGYDITTGDGTLINKQP